MLTEQKKIFDIGNAYTGMITEEKENTFDKLKKQLKGETSFYRVKQDDEGIQVVFKTKEIDEEKTLDAVKKMVESKLSEAGLKDVKVEKHGDNALKIMQDKKDFAKSRIKDQGLVEATDLNEDGYANLVLSSVNGQGREGAVIYNPGKNKNVPTFCSDNKNYGVKVKVWQKRLMNNNDQKTLTVTLLPTGRWKVVE